jgi:hypothetical protein
VAREIKDAIKRGVNVHLIVDGKVNEHTEVDKKDRREEKGSEFSPN